MAKVTSESMVHEWTRAISTTRLLVVTSKPSMVMGTVLPAPGGLITLTVLEKLESGVRTVTVEGRPTPAEPSLSAIQTVTSPMLWGPAKLNWMVGLERSQPVRGATSATVMEEPGNQAMVASVPSVSSVPPLSG